MQFRAAIFSIVSAIIVGLIFVRMIAPLHAVGNLEAMRDTVNTTQPAATAVEHEVSFRLPHNSQQISDSDYITIDMSAFSNVTVATSISGTYSGTPTITLVGSEVKITNITLIPGQSLTINGITATNPMVDGGYPVTIILSSDQASTLINNVGTVIASTTNGSVTVTATVDPPVASLVVTGYTGPGTFVTITENGSVIGTDSANQSGFFSQVLTGLQPATHSLRIYGVDQSGRTTPPIFLQVYTPIYQQTTVSDIVLPPTIQISTTSIIQGENLVALGTGVPSGDISLFTESPLRSYSSTIDSNGDWNYTITDTSDYNPGDYRVYGIAQSGSLQSLSSTALGFTVSAAGTTPTPANCNIDRGDINCDDTVNLPDFSILMFYWGTPQPAGDVNSDLAVNLIDFSIMMFYWGM